MPLKTKGPHGSFIEVASPPGRMWKAGSQTLSL